jgi:zinc/manganese transport system substrate-binding protein
MRRIVSWLSLLALASAWALAPNVARAELQVVATVPALAALAQAVGSGHVKVTAVALPTQDPHFVDARPHLALALARADLLLVIGLELEVGWLPTLQLGSRNGNVQRGAKGYVDCSQFVTVLGTREGKVDRSMGDIHPGGSPHYLYDPRRAAQVAAGIAKRMGELDPEHAADFTRAAEQLKAELERARTGWEKALQPLRGAHVIAYHESLVYLADWVGFEVVAHVEPKPGIPPNPRHVAQVLIAARARQVKLIVQEGYYPKTTSEMLAERAGARLAVLPGGPDVGRGQRYADFVGAIVAQLAGKRGP